MDEMAREADLQDIKNEVTKAKSGSSDWVKDIDPTGEVSKSMKDAKAQVSAAKDSINKSARPNFPDKTPSASTTASSSETDSPSTTIQGRFRYGDRQGNCEKGRRKESTCHTGV